MEEYEEMTNAQFDSLLEQLAKRIENETGNKEAAEIVRSAKTEQKKTDN